MRSNLNKLSPDGSSGPPSSPYQASPSPSSKPRPPQPPSSVSVAALNRRPSMGPLPPNGSLLNRTNSVGRIVSNFENGELVAPRPRRPPDVRFFGQDGVIGQESAQQQQQQQQQSRRVSSKERPSFNAAASRFLLERQKSSPNFSASSESNNNSLCYQYDPRPMPEQHPRPARQSPPQLKTKFRLGDGDIEICPTPPSTPRYGTLGRKWDYRGPTSLAKPPKPPPPAASSKPTLRHTVSVQPKPNAETNPPTERITPSGLNVRSPTLTSQQALLTRPSNRHPSILQLLRNRFQLMQVSRDIYLQRRSRDRA